MKEKPRSIKIVIDFVTTEELHSMPGARVVSLIGTLVVRHVSNHGNVIFPIHSKHSSYADEPWYYPNHGVAYQHGIIQIMA